MADATEIKLETTAAASETPAATSNPTTEAATGVSADAAAAPQAAAMEAAPATEAKDAAPAAAATSAEPGASEGAAAAGKLNVRPGFDFAKFRPDFSRLRPSSSSAALAASLGFACGVGLLIGAVGTMGVGHLRASTTSTAAPKPAAVDETRALKHTVAQIEQQLAALKTSIDHSNKVVSAQTKSLAERYDRSTRAQSDLQSKLSKIGDSVERLEKRVATATAADTTGSVKPQQVASIPVPTPAPAPPEAKKPAPPHVIDGWVIRDVFRGRALVASRYGVFEAAPGLELPGLGVVESVKRQDGQWVVITDKGLIVAARGARTHYRFD
jgi:hypothetical protein